MGESYSLGFFNLRAKFLPHVVQRARIHFARDKEMRTVVPALRGTPRHQPGDGAAAVNRRGRRSSFGFSSSENVGSEDFSAGPRSADSREIDATLAGKASRFGGNLDALRRGQRRSR